MSLLLAQFVGRWTLVEVLVAIIVIAAIVAITVVALRHFGVSIPQPIIYILWILAVAVLAIVAIRFLLTV